MQTNEKKYSNKKYTNEKKGTNKKYTNEKSIWTEKSIKWKTPLKFFFLAKRNGKCAQPNQNAVLSDRKCTWSNKNLGYGDE